MGDGASPCFGERTDNRTQNTSYQICKAQVLVFGKDTRISLVWMLQVPTVAVPGPLSTILCQGHLRNPLCSLRVVTFLPRSALTARASVLSKSRWHLTAPSPFPSHCPGVAPISKLSVVDLIQPGGRAGREIRVPPAAAGGEVGARSIPGQDPHGLGHPLSALSHDAQAVVWVNQAGD